MNNFKELDELTKDGYLRKVEDGNLVLFNYTDKTTFEGKWNEFTLKSRGTVYNKNTSEVVGKAFDKFFNFGELSIEKQTDILEGNGVYSEYTVSEKMDGSLGIIFHDGEKWRVNTRGSFTSDQAIKATEMLSKYRNFQDMDKDFTLLVEIIYPENKIIVNYGDEEKLVLLGVYNRKTLNEIDKLDIVGKILKMEVAKLYNHTISEMIELQKTIPKDEEGFVVRFSNGERVKFKGAEYLQIARILKGCSPLALFETMENGIVDVEFLSTIPEEIYPEIEPVVNKLQSKFLNTLADISVTFIVCRDTLNLADEINNEDRKKLGLFLKEEKLVHSNVMFSFYLGNRDAVEKYIMKFIRPKANKL